MTLTIDADVYDMIKELPRKVSISEFVSFVLKAMYQDIKKGRELTQMDWLCSLCGFTTNKRLLNCPLCGDILILFDCEVIENAINS